MIRVDGGIDYIFARRKSISQRRVVSFTSHATAVPAGLPRLLQGDNKHPYYVFFQPLSPLPFETPTIALAAALWEGCFQHASRPCDRHLCVRKERTNPPDGSNTPSAEVKFMASSTRRKGRPSQRIPQGSWSRPSPASGDRECGEQEVGPGVWSDIEIPEVGMTDCGKSGDPLVELT